MNRALLQMLALPFAAAIPFAIPNAASGYDSDPGDANAFYNADTNSDGFVDLNEWEATGGTYYEFSVADVNSDGGVSYSEWMIYYCTA